MKYPSIKTALPGPKATKLIHVDRTHVSPSYTRIYPLVVEEAQGLWVNDVDGNVFLDFTAGIAVCATGHCHPKVVKVIKEQAEQLLHMSGTDFYYTPQIALAEKLSSLIGKYVEDFKGEREKFDKRRNKEEARRLNDMAVKNFYVGKVELAIRQLKEAVLLDDTSPEILANLAVALSKDGKQKDARKIFEKVLGEKPDMVEAQVGMGLILFERGNIDEAIEIFKEASKKNELEAFTYANLGYAYEQKELIDKAVLNWEKALELDPTLKDVGERLKLYKDKEA